LVICLTFDGYNNIVGKSTTKSIFESLGATYERYQQVKEVKANLLIQHYETFIMKEDEDIGL
jgi:hypothetical protein